MSGLYCSYSLLLLSHYAVDEIKKEYSDSRIIAMTEAQNCNMKVLLHENLVGIDQIFTVTRKNYC